VSNHLSRRGFLGLGAGTAAAALAGCSGFTPSSSSGGAGSTATAGKSLVFRWWGGDARNQAYTAALKIFTQKTGIAVTTQYSGYDGYFDKLNTEFAGGNPPDVFQMDTALVSTYATKNVLIDLSQYVPGTIQTSTLYAPLRTAGTVNGKNYGVASGSGYAPVLYDETVLNQLKIDLPKDTWTWDDFAAVTNEITKAWGSGKYGALDASNDDSGAFQPWLRQRGKDLYDSSGALAFDADDLTEWFTFWAGLRKTGAVCPTTLLANAGDASGTHPLIAGQIAMTTGWGLAQMQPLTQHTLKLVVVPRSSDGKTGQALNGGVLLSIPQKSTNPVGAAKLIDFFLTDTDGIKAMALTRGLPPSDKALNTLLPTLNASQKEDVTYGQYVAGQVTKDALPDAPVSPPGYGDVKTALDSAAKQVGFGKLTISAAVSQFFSDAKTALDNAK
jgi:multiple sugar transport system substrate-binding protein